MAGKTTRSSRAKQSGKKPAKKTAKKTAVPKRAAGPRRAGKSRAGKPATKIKPWSATEVREAFERFRKASPEPRGELEHINPYTLLVAVALSAQATDAGVNRATRNLFPIADTPEKMVALG